MSLNKRSWLRDSALACISQMWPPKAFLAATDSWVIILGVGEQRPLLWDHQQGLGPPPPRTTNARGSGSHSEIPHLPGSGGLGLLASSLGDGVAGSGCEALGSGPSLAVAGASPGLTTIPLPLALTASLPIQGLLCSSACLV